MGIWGWLGALATWLALQLWILPRLGVATCAVPRQPTYPPPAPEPLLHPHAQTAQQAIFTEHSAHHPPWPRPLRAEYRNGRPQVRRTRYPRQP